MTRKIFKYRLVYYLAVITSLIFFIISSLSLLEIFNNFSILKTLIIVFSLVVNAFAFINLIEKYDKAVLFLNISLLISTGTIGYPLLLRFLNGYYLTGHLYFNFFALFIAILIIINVFKVKKFNGINEIENIGKHED
ncbi:hypothetical protein CRN76_04340 [Chryseobacterium indologenes]|uniref:hypothetical protein n=1 Tax=Chryseobacterium indologenes TaxID=253 RepID=UPI000BFCC4EE|nr:hypothetical protein [Chryseobacterium indologenes]ATN04685.1 hypothetical protein CRN76_04340 [Chryseobacterium indologenes]AYY86563.1 hypothetical protein EGX91_19420 [Chryseobacterium indologenes]QIX83459.1 hypothetical protein FOB56_20405 [Chryseobacterium indologenes]UDQ53154.1 hypothetical protein LJF28_17195 [Chryseobacterium indologenes]HAO27028.1 hypothetical protein [Chryseobacterium indologenes]